MIDVLLVIGVLCMVVAISMLISALTNADEQALADFHYCYGCPCGWCTAVPDSEECRKWREEIDGERVD